MCELAAFGCTSAAYSENVSSTAASLATFGRGALALTCSDFARDHHTSCAGTAPRRRRLPASPAALAAGKLAISTLGLSCCGILKLACQRPEAYCGAKPKV